MKKALQSSEYILLPQAFREWLQLLNYSGGSVQVLPGHVQEFLYYQELQGKLSLDQLEATDATAFIHSLQQQTGERTHRPFSAGHINKQIQALNLFSQYIRETGRCGTGFVLERLPGTRGKPTWLTKREIQALYDVTGDSVLGIRDRAMFAVYYGCGLRLNEGASLELRDIISDRRLLHVRKGKCYKERYVPIAAKNYEALRLYMGYGRPLLLQVGAKGGDPDSEAYRENKTEALFIDANKGHPMQKQSLYVRIKQLLKRAKIKKKVGTHTLRHSITPTYCKAV